MESWKVAVAMMKPGDYIVGGIFYGLANAVVSTVIDCIMDGVPQLEIKGFMSKLVSSRPLSHKPRNLEPQPEILDPTTSEVWDKCEGC